jgi:hypothetical protein
MYLSLRLFPVFLFLVFSAGIAKGQPLNTTDNLAKADSFYLTKNYIAAGKIYEALIKDSSRDALHLNRLGYCELQQGNYGASQIHLKRALASNPAPGIRASVFSRLAMLDALQGRATAAIVLLDSAIRNGYISIPEMDSLVFFNAIRGSTGFKALRNQLFNSLYPCFQDAKARQFDFWVGEWDVYVTGTNAYAGNSVVQKISGGCALLENWNSSVSEGKSLNYIDDSTSKWKQVWVGSYTNGKQDFVNGEYKDGAMRFTFITKDAQGRTVQGKFTFFNEGVNQVRQLNETSADGGKTWITNYDFTYKRKGKGTE